MYKRQYQDCTLRNTLCAPVSRSAFLLSKTVIWFLWFFLSASAAMLLTLSGARLLFPSGFGTDELLLIAGQLTQQALLVFLTSLPAPVSYTHLDVYKRQVPYSPSLLLEDING